MKICLRDITSDLNQQVVYTDDSFMPKDFVADESIVDEALSKVLGHILKCFPNGFGMSKKIFSTLSEICVRIHCSGRNLSMYWDPDGHPYTIDHSVPDRLFELTITR